MAKTSVKSELLAGFSLLKKDCLALIRDEKPKVPFWMNQQLARMHTGFFITDLPQAYTRNNAEDKALETMAAVERNEYMRTTKGLFPVHTMTKALITETAGLANKLAARGISNIRFMGADVAARKADYKSEPGYSEADAFMLGRSDFIGLHQFADAVERRLKGEDPETCKPIILHNFKDYWGPSLQGLGIDDEKLAELKEHNIFIVSSLPQAAQICRDAGIETDKPAQPIAPKLPIKPGSTILVATRQNRKIHELQKIFDALGADIDVLPFHTVVGRPREAEEISGTCIGNNMEKMAEVKKKISALSTGELERRLHRHGCKLDETTLVLCDDRSLEFDTAFFAEPEFAHLQQHLNPHKRGPGVEMANFLRAIPNIGDMYHTIGKIYNRLEKEGRKPTRDAYDYACYALAPINDLDNILMMTATTEDEIVVSPKFETKIGYSEDYLRLKSTPHFSKNTTPDFMVKHSSMAQAVQGIAAVSGLASSREFTVPGVSVFKDFSANSGNNRQGHWRIGLPQSGSMPGSLARQPSSLRILNNGLRQNFNLVAWHHSYDPSIEHSFTVASAEGHREPWYSSLVSAYQYAKEMDGFYFRPLGPAATLQEEIARDWSFFNVLVGKQTFSPDYHSKPFVVDTRYAKRQLENYDYLHKVGMIGDAPNYLMHQVNSKTKAQKIFGHEFKHYVRPNDVESIYSDEGQTPDGLFRVTVYCSASSRNDALRVEARRFGRLGAEAGFNVVTGGGNDGLMKEVSDGVIEYRHHELACRPERVVVNGLISIQCIDTIESEGEYPHADRKERHPSIYHRMDNLQKNEASVFLAGGAGTLQEFYAECLERLRTGQVENRPLILVNQKIRCGDEELGVWDKLVSTLPKGLEKACNVHIVDTVEAAMDICLEARAARGMTMKTKLNPYLSANENILSAAAMPSYKLGH